MNNYKQIIIAQIGQASAAPFFAPHTGLIWARSYYYDQAVLDASFWVTVFSASFDNLESEPVNINTVTQEASQLTRYSSLNDLYLPSVSEAFYFDVSIQLLYIKNFGPNHPPWQTPGISAGIVLGLSSASDTDSNRRPVNQAFFGQDHEPRLIASSINDEVRLEDWSKNQMKFRGISFDFINSDGEYDGIRASIMNQRLDLLMAEVEEGTEVLDSDFSVISTAVIDSVSFPNDSKGRITASDRRKSWEDTAPNDVYTVGFGGLVSGDELIGKNMQVVIGKRNKIECPRLSSGEYHIGLASSDRPITSVSAVYFLVEDTYTSTTAYTVDLDTGILSLTVPSQGDDKRIACDCIGINAPSIIGDGVDNTPIDIAILLIELYGGMPYTDSFYDRNAIDTIRAGRNPVAGIAIPTKGAVLKDLIDACTFSVNTVFYQNGPLFSLAAITPSGEDSGETFMDELASTPSLSYSVSDYMSRISIGYGKDSALDKSQWANDDQYEEEAVIELQYKKQYDFETILDTESDALTYGLERYALSYLPQAEIKIQSLPPLSFGYLDNTILHFTSHGRERVARARWRVTGINKIRHTATLKYIEELPA